MEKYLMYLRKSRADRDAELQGEGETLARHERLLMEYALKHNLNIVKVYKEIVSGETIASRPEVQKLLTDIESGEYTGVLVVEIERLARGDTSDQGYITSAFKYSKTKIITPTKTYDPNDEFDEEYFEFGLFMSRREYKTINRRIQRGRIASVNEGKYIASTAPYGYERVKIKNGKGYTLEIVDKESDVVKMIFDLYVNGKSNESGSYEQMGMTKIADMLNSLCFPTRTGGNWNKSSVADILHNPTYIGKIRWNYRTYTKSLHSTKRSRKMNDDLVLVNGLHKPIIDDVTFSRAQNLSNSHICTGDNTLQNPLSGLIFCKKCGRMMTRLGVNSHCNYPTLKCPNRDCNNISAPLEVVESKVLEALKDWTLNTEFELNTDRSIIKFDSILIDRKKSINRIQKNITALTTQLNKAYDFLERGVYTIDVFKERSKKLNCEISELNDNLQSLKSEYIKISQSLTKSTDFLPKVKDIVDVYYTFDTAVERNYMLKQVIERIDYVKSERNKRGQTAVANFELTILPNIDGL